MAPVATASTGRSASKPSGFRKFANGALLEPSRAEHDRQEDDHHARRPRMRANHLHRGDGRCPSGNSRNRNVTGRPTIGIHIGLSNASAIEPRCSPADAAVDRVARVGPHERAQADGGADAQHEPAERVVRPADRQEVPDEREQAEAEQEAEVGLGLPGIEDREPDAARDAQDRQTEDEAGEQPQARRAHRACAFFGRARHGGMVPRPLRGDQARGLYR